jgi:hypothetical protein
LHDGVTRRCPFTRRHTGVLLLILAESCGALDDELVA